MHTGSRMMWDVNTGTSGRPWRLGHRAALDGLRGVAVLMVVVSHAFVDIADSRLAAFGEDGVQIFFVLSGFLITSLLLDELETCGRVDLRAFYGRRARRLAPALLVVVLAVVAVSPWLGTWWTTPRQIVGALTWSSNYVAPSTDYGHALGHVWSLAIEEQFYLVWPVLLMALMRFRYPRPAIVAMLAALVLWSVSPASAWHFHHYYGTDLRAIPLLSGALLAMVMRRRLEQAPTTVITWASLGLLAFVAATWEGPVLRSVIEPLVVTVLSALAIWGCTQATTVHVLGGRALGYVGHRSYGLYLWHPVVFWLLIRAGVDSSTLLLTVGAPIAFGLAEVSWRLVEDPVQRRRSGDAGDAAEKLIGDLAGSAHAPVR